LKERRSMAKKAPMNIQEIRLYNMVDMGLRYSGMIRLYKKGTKQKLINKILKLLPQISNADSSEVFEKYHYAFCRWATKNILSSKSILNEENISYGQAAKTLDVTLSVLLYYCNWPNQTRSKKLIKWIHAAIDTDMMKYLKKYYKNDLKEWPTTVKDVDRVTYRKLQDLVKRFISEEDPEIELPVQFDDKYWYLLKEKLLTENK